MYHRIDNVNPLSTVQGHYVSPRLFERQMRALKSLGWQTISMTEAVRKWVSGEPIEPKTFAITFDDGNENFHTHALPLLTELAFDSMVFLVADLVGKVNQWDIVEGDVEERLMSHQQILECQGHGVEFGSHTSSHAHLDLIPLLRAQSEIQDSKLKLEQLLGRAVTHFCYPYGGTNLEVRNLVEEAGYKAAHSTKKGSNRADSDLFLLRRVNIRSDCRLPVFLYKLWRDQRVAN